MVPIAEGPQMNHLDIQKHEGMYNMLVAMYVEIHGVFWYIYSEWFREFFKSKEIWFLYILNAHVPDVVNMDSIS